MEFLVDQKHDGVLLRSYLKGTCGVSSRLLTQLKKRPEGITVNGNHVTVRYILRAGDLLRVDVDDSVPQEAFPPVELPFTILYEDDDLLIVDKPPNMPTHPSAGHNGDTLANGLTWLFEQRGEPFVFRPVSRLDRNTSGIITLAKNQYAAGILCKAMKAHQIKKTYLAVTEGFPPKESDTVSTGTRRQKEFFVLREVCDVDDEGAALTVTAYNVRKRYANHALLELYPLTGRTHQIRVHLAYLGCPIVGDDLYGRESELISRHALHATRVELNHPSTGEAMVFESPMPEDLQRLCDLL
ncbi:MAG: RluA family pseudouridine synthase [Clostridia bacterium]|nr:RluA family pseudouridine synthase [Clostridia bacterium]